MSHYSGLLQLILIVVANRPLQLEVSIVLHDSKEFIERWSAQIRRKSRGTTEVITEKAERNFSSLEAKEPRGGEKEVSLKKLFKFYGKNLAAISRVYTSKG